jgi:hypothetical protein
LHYGAGDKLPIGTFLVVCVVGAKPFDSTERFTVQRRIDFMRWYPLTARSDPAWKTWPTREACVAEVMEGDEFICGDWPHWGRA